MYRADEQCNASGKVSTPTEGSASLDVCNYSEPDSGWNLLHSSTDITTHLDADSIVPAVAAVFSFR